MGLLDKLNYRPQKQDEPQAPPPTTPDSAVASGIPTTPEPPVVPPAPPPDPPVTMTQFLEFQRTMTGQLTEAIQALKPAPSPVTEPQIDDVADEDFERAIEAGGAGAAKVVQKRLAAEAERMRRNLISEHIAPLQQFGVHSLSSLALKEVQSLPYFGSYKGEIEEILKSMPPASRTNPEAVKGVYDFVIGRHVGDIVNSEKEALLRNAAIPQKDPNAPPARQTVKGPDGTEVPSPYEVLDASQLGAIGMIYGSTSMSVIDQFCRKNGCRGGWVDYYKKYFAPKTPA